MIRRPPRSTLSSSSAASDVYKRQVSTQSTGHSEGNMGRKGKTQKHTAAEIAGKHKAAKEAAGAAKGGNKGKEERAAKKASGNIACALCKAPQPNLPSMERHYDSKHSKLNWNDEKTQYEPK
eukprot:TRINITY_DN5851_c0_g1_i3.p1 TRINITY_DN5851_c0_g1~~TRINITY_DN5851_c0_g1_i3.p1  ORF type:complete len:122 (-),score=41.54 TRINITY_DN5851_c0_g1_i3:262-627(-)